ncbi:MAG: FAD-dependent oxidoreductase [Gordonia sp.]|nr:FAD-dependent oxidoreductase [Gordonia sp. (in: high G+C Gram-positive bacteria)]
MSAATVIVGAGLGGARLVADLRNEGYEGELILIGKETRIPYDRPPLSKAVLTGDKDDVDLQPQEFYAEKNVDLRTGTRVTAIDPDAHTVTVEPVEGGVAETVSYSTLILATGLDPRSLPFAAGKSGVHTLRTYDDAMALRSEIEGASTAVVIGAGFIGCEVAASLSTKGLQVTVVEPALAPLAIALGEQVGAMVGRIHADRGVEIRTGVGVTDIIGDGKVTGVRLADDTELPADIVVLGIGSTPVVDYLDGSGIALADREFGGGIACDEVGRTSVPDVYAIGDVANWRDEHGVPSRVEHWNNVVEQAAKVAYAILEVDESNARPFVPYFWSDQFEVKVQALGHPSAGDDVHVVSDDGTKFVVYYSRDGVFTAVVGAGKAGAVMKMRAKLLEKTPIAELIG